VHLGGETSPTLLSDARECAHDNVRAAPAGVNDLTPDGAHPATDAIAVDGATHGTGHDEAESGGTLVLAVEAIVDG